MIYYIKTNLNTEEKQPCFDFHVWYSRKLVFSAEARNIHVFPAAAGNTLLFLVWYSCLNNAWDGVVLVSVQLITFFNGECYHFKKIYTVGNFQMVQLYEKAEKQISEITAYEKQNNFNILLQNLWTINCGAFMTTHIHVLSVFAVLLVQLCLCEFVVSKIYVSYNYRLSLTVHIQYISFSIKVYLRYTVHVLR